MSNNMGHKEGIPNSILRCRSQGNRKSAESFGYFEKASSKGQFSFSLDFADLVTLPVLDRWQDLRERPRTDLVAAGWCSIVKGLMRPFKIVDVTPSIESLLAMGDITEDCTLQYFGFQGAVKPFVFTLGLRMAGPAMANRDSQTHQPDGKKRMRMLHISSPRRAVVHDHTFRQPVTTEDLDKFFLSSSNQFVRAAFKSKSKSGMVIKHCQRVAAALYQWEMTFKIHLLELVRRFMFEELPGPVFGGLCLVDKTMSMKNSGDGAWRRYHNTSLSQKPCPDLASAPGRVLQSEIDYPVFNICQSMSRRVVGRTRLIRQSGDAFALIPGQPFVARARADTKTPTQFPDSYSLRKNHVYKFLARRHDRHLFPGHTNLLSSLLPNCKVYTMSPNTCILSLQSIHRGKIRKTLTNSPPDLLRSCGIYDFTKGEELNNSTDVLWLSTGYVKNQPWVKHKVRKEVINHYNLHGRIYNTG
jgi:hypothetical protein